MGRHMLPLKGPKRPAQYAPVSPAIGDDIAISPRRADRKWPGDAPDLTWNLRAVLWVVAFERLFMVDGVHCDVPFHGRIQTPVLGGVS